MDLKEIVKNWLIKAYKKFDGMSFKYIFENDSQTHIVEVYPLNAYKYKEDYIEMESEFIHYFNNSFYPESIFFVSEESLTRVSNPEFILESSFRFSYNKIQNEAKYNFGLDLKSETDYRTNYALAA